MKPIDVGAVIRHPVSTEKAIRLMEAENVLVFSVDPRATKLEIAKAVQTQFSAHVAAVRTLINMKGKKIAYVKFAKNTPAIDIATNLGMI